MQQYKNLSDTNWLTKVFKHKFTVENGEVRLKSRIPPAPKESFPAPQVGGSSSSKALPAGHSVPALLFRGVVEQPGARAAKAAARLEAERIKEEKKKARLDAYSERLKQQQLRQLAREVRRMT